RLKLNKKYMKSYNILLFILVALGYQTAAAQERLSLREAVTAALENNYDIKLVNNDVEIAKNNVNLGNAGVLPGLQGNFSNGGSRQNTVQTTSTGEERKNDGVRNTNMNYGVALDWTIF